MKKFRQSTWALYPRCSARSWSLRKVSTGILRRGFDVIIANFNEQKMRPATLWNAYRAVMVSICLFLVAAEHHGFGKWASLAHCDSSFAGRIAKDVRLDPGWWMNERPSVRLRTGEILLFHCHSSKMGGVHQVFCKRKLQCIGRFLDARQVGWGMITASMLNRYRWH